MYGLYFVALKVEIVECMGGTLTLPFGAEKTSN